MTGSLEQDVLTLELTLFDDLLLKGKNVRVSSIDSNFDPVHVKVTEALDPSEVLQSSVFPIDGHGPQWLVDEEEMPVSVGQDNWLAEFDRQCRQRLQELVEAGPVLFFRIKLEPWISVDYDKHTRAIELTRCAKGMLQPVKV